MKQFPSLYPYNANQNSEEISFFTSHDCPLRGKDAQHVSCREGVHVWIANVDDSTSDVYLPYLSHEEEKTQQKFCEPYLQKRYGRAHGFLRCVLSRYLEVNPKAIPIHDDSLGKPYVEKSDVHFNLSHAHSLAVVAIRFGGSVGVDVEYVHNIAERWHIIERWFSPQEKQWIKYSSTPDKDFFRCWVCREAILKAHGTGLAELETVTLSPHDDKLCLKNSAFNLVEFSPQASYVGAIAYL